MSENTEENKVQKIEWLHQSFVKEWPELETHIKSLSASSPEATFIRSQIIASFFFIFYNIENEKLKS